MLGVANLDLKIKYYEVYNFLSKIRDKIILQPILRSRKQKTLFLKNQVNTKAYAQKSNL